MKSFYKEKFISRYSNHMIIILISFLTLISCEQKPKQPSPPVDVPIALDKGGEVVEFEIYIKKEDLYTFGLLCMVDKKIPEDRKNLLKLIDGEGDVRQVLVSFDLQIWLMVNDNSSLILEKQSYITQTIAYGSDNILKRMIDLDLKPGLYRVRAKNLDAAMQFENRKVNFHVRRAYQGK